MRNAILVAFTVTLGFALTTGARLASAQDMNIWADYTAQGKRTTGYWLATGTNTPEVFLNREICEGRVRSLLSVLQSLNAEIHSIRCE
jgi:hypothetical protein